MASAHRELTGEQPAPRRRIPSADRPGALVAALALIGALFVALPVLGLVWRSPWSDVVHQLGRREVRDALWLSVQSSVGATAFALVIGLPLAWVLARGQFRGRGLLRAAVILPMVMPPVVGGLALLLAFGRVGLFGQWLYRWGGVTLPYTIWAAILAEAYVALPFLVITAAAGFRAIDRGKEEAARTLGARRWMVFRYVTLPMAWPSVVAGTVLCWARALGEFGATITFAGDSPRTDTMPLQVNLLFSTDPAAAIMVSLVLLVVSALVLLGLRDRWWGAWR